MEEPTNNNPRRLLAVHSLKILGQPVNLLVCQSKWTTILSIRTFGLIRSDNPMSQIGFCIDLDEMDHSMVE